MGCIPSKALLESSELYAEAQGKLGEHGVCVGEVDLDLAAMLSRKERVVRTLTQGAEALFSLEGPGRVPVGDPANKPGTLFWRRRASRQCSRALSRMEIGSGPPPGLKLPWLSTWTGFCRGCASVFGTSHSTTHLPANHADACYPTAQAEPKTLELDSARIRLDAKGRIPVDDHFPTATQDVYAIGDLIRGPMLAHEAAHRDGVRSRRLRRDSGGGLHTSGNRVRGQRRRRSWPAPGLSFARA